MMEGQNIQIFERLKEMRESLEIGVDHAALTCGVAPDEYRLFESGEKDIPVGILHRMSKHYGFDMTVLLTGEAPQVKTYALTRKGKGVVVSRRTMYNYESLAANFVNRKADPYFVIIEPKEDPTPQYNAHPGQEFSYVLEGQVQIFIGEQEMILNPGDSVYFDSGLPHALMAMNGRAAKILAMII